MSEVKITEQPEPIERTPGEPAIKTRSVADPPKPATPERVDAVEKAFEKFLQKPPEGVADESSVGERPPAKQGEQAKQDQAAPPAPKTPEQIAAEKQEAILDEKLAALRDRNADRRARGEIRAQQTHVEQQQQQLAQERKRLADLGITPDMTPAQITEHLQARALAEKDPVLKQAMDLRDANDRIARLEKQITDDQQQRQHQAQAGMRSQAEQQILSSVKDPKFAVLHDYLMNDDEVVLSAHHAADQIRVERQRRGLDPNAFSIADVTDKMLRTIQARDTHFKQRRVQTSATSETPGGAPSETNGTSGGTGAPQNGQLNPLNPALSDRRDSGQRPLSRKEREALTERIFEPYLKKRGYRE